MRESRSACFLLALLPMISGGCGQTGSEVGVHATGQIDPSLTYYHSYGDSITSGYTLADATTQAYPALVAKAIAIPLTNHAIAGDQACDLANRQIFPNADSPTTAANGLYSILISTNDVDIKGAGSYESTFNLCLGAAIAWVALPLETKVLATSSAVTSSGSVHLDTTNNWNALITTAPNDSITLPIHLAATGPVYLWYRIVDGNPGTFSYAIDGEVVGSATTSPVPVQQTQNGTYSSLGLIRIAAVAAGSHTLTVKQTNASPGQVGIVAAGIPPASLLRGMPTLFVGTTPRQLEGGTGACAKSDTPCQAYIADITAQVTLFAGDGLNVHLFNSRKYMKGTPSDMSDSVHPNATGHIEIGQALADTVN